MGRASASIQNRELAKQFAQLVTAPTSCVNDMIARSGPLSIFAALSECCPESVRGRGVNQKYGIAEAEFNKAVQACGFIRERDRRVNAMTRTSDPLGAGMYLFSMRRWRDLNDPQDKTELENGWAALCERLPWISKQCSLEHFMDIVGKFHDDWQPNAGRARKKPRFESTSPCNAHSKPFEAPSLSRGSTESSMEPVASLDCSSPTFNSHFTHSVFLPSTGAHRPCFAPDMLSNRPPSLDFASSTSAVSNDAQSGDFMSTVLKILHEQQRQSTQLQIASLTAALQPKAPFSPLSFSQQQVPSIASASLPSVNVSVRNSLCNVQSLSPCSSAISNILGLGKRDRPACMQFS